MSRSWISTCYWVFLPVLRYQQNIRNVLYIFLFVFVFTVNYNWSTQEIAIISSTYFTHEKSGYPPNTMAVLFNSQKSLWPPRPFICITNNATDVKASLARIRYAFEPIYICRWAVYILTCPIVANPTSFAITDTRFSSGTITIPHRQAVQKQMGVVACFSPLFYNERWQLLIQTLEIYRQLGVDLQVFYVQSMLQEIHEFLQVYEKLNIARIETWNQLRFDPERTYSLGYDPNAELEWRNQATAHTDCFLNYKQSAEFIIISDIDDILFPKLGSTYLEEFRRLSSTFPYSAGFSYSRYNTEIESSRSPSDFSLSSLISSARIADEWEDGKYVVKPQHVETVWLHWPGLMQLGYRLYAVDEDVNIMVHMRNWSMVNVNTNDGRRSQRFFNMFKYQINDIIRSELIDTLDRNFRRFLRLYAQNEFNRLPYRIIYYPLIESCYNRIFYGRSKHPTSCPGPLRCEIPKVPGLKCAVAKREYQHVAMNGNVKLHFPISPGEFGINSDGCAM
ncbi:protein of unknown function DUF23 domain-containing protein [Aphelenchoides besseyi]|nr:protein of unknown function DUF23 domain-containing protein [Aphelenchoides besseyi]